MKPIDILFFIALACALAGCSGNGGLAAPPADAGPPIDANAHDSAVSETGAPPIGDAASDASPTPVPDAASDASPSPADSGGPGCGTFPTAGVYATFSDGGDVFHVSITNPAGIQSALGLWHGTSTAKIPDGVLKCQQATWNCPWHWQLDPATVDFADLTTEVCDGRPTDVESGCASFGGGRYCPWSVTLTELRDCRTDASCPLVPK
jgi:hypothetical protein